jgi:hypothetical protein
MGHQTRIIYIENKGGGYVEQWGQQVPSGGELTGPGRIGRATFSKTGKTIYYGGKTFNRWNGVRRTTFAKRLAKVIGSQGRRGEAEIRCTRRTLRPKIDEDVREEYWTEIRNQPERKAEACTT